jgi:hypothetical protein
MSIAAPAETFGMCAGGAPAVVELRHPFNRAAERQWRGADHGDACPIRFRPDAARQRRIDEGRVLTLQRVYSRPGEPALWAVIIGLPSG